MSDEVINQPWKEFKAGQSVRWTMPAFVKRGVVVERKKRSMRIRFSDYNEVVIPDAKHYWVLHTTGDRAFGLCRIANLPGEGQARTELNLDADDDLMSTGDACKLFGVQGKELRRWLRNGKVEGHQSNGEWQVSAQSLGRFLSEKR